MGHEIVYCADCGRRLTVHDFGKGQARRFGDRILCTSCAPPAAAAPHPRREGGRPTRSGAGDPTSGERPATRKIPVPSGPPSRRYRLLAGLVAAGTLGIAILVVAGRGNRRSGTSGEGPAAGREAPAQKAWPTPSPSEVRAHEALENARRFARSNPDDLDGQIVAYAEAVRLSEGTPLQGQAREALRVRWREALSRERTALEERIQSLIGREEFGAAMEALRQALGRRDDPEWTSALETKIREVRRNAEELLSRLREHAMEARRKGALDEARAIRDRVARWGMEDLAAALTRDLEAAGPAPEPPPAPASEAALLPEAWKRAMGRASGGDLEGAAAELARAFRDAGDEGWRQRASEDAEDLRKLASLRAEVLRILSEWPRGEVLPLEYRDEGGGKRCLEAALVRTGPARGEFAGREGKPLFVEWSDVTAAGLGKVLRRRRGSLSESERRLLALGCLLEGEPEAAGTFLEEAGGGLPQRHWAYARGGARPPRPGPSARELEARRVFYAAEADFRRMETLGRALEQYRTLLDDYLDTALVRGDLSWIQRRASAGKEYLLLAEDLKGRGAMHLTAHPELKSCWTCREDVTDPAQARETYVEIEFHALPGTIYQGWVYAGACCEETFALYLQATEMTGPNPRKKSEKIPYDVGGPVAAPLAPKIRGLKKTHAQHGGEKQASQWEWIPLPLPRYGSGGLKKVRLLAEHRGFSVAMALVTSLGKAPPKGRELKEEMARAEADRPPLPPASRDAPEAGGAPPAGRIVFSENFDAGPGRFKGGEPVEGGVNGTKALAVPPRGAEVWGAFTVTVRDTTAFRFKIRPPPGVSQVSVNIWSERHKENLRYHVRGLKAGEWKTVLFRALDMRAGWDMSGPPAEPGDPLKSFKLYYPGPEDARVLLDDFEVRE